MLEPPAPGREYAITSNEVFDLPAMPKRLLIIGAGYIAVEFASIFARLGTKVSIATRGENVLRGFDEDMRCGVRDALIRAGVDIHFNQLLRGIEKTADGLRTQSTEGLQLDVDQVMIATGRRPNTAGLGLENAGVKLDRVGAVKVDAFSQSNVASIYAVGDVTEPAGADADRHPRGPRLRRHGVRRQADRRRACECPDRRLHDAGGRHGRPLRERSARDLRYRRYLRGELSPAEGDAVRARPKKSA